MLRKLDIIVAGLSGAVAGLCAVDFAYSLANYYAQTEAITQKIYSTAQTITPEVVQRADELIAQVADKPDYLNGIFGATIGIFAIGLTVNNWK